MSLASLKLELAELIISLNGILTAFCQLLALFIIAIGVSRALFIYLKGALVKSEANQAFQRSRLVMGYSFSLALSFLIGATILKTMISSHWDDIARLASIIAVRTVLNFLLMRAINEADPVVAQSTAAPAVKEGIPS